jgi:hypothetical protein
VFKAGLAKILRASMEQRLPASLGAGHDVINRFALPLLLSQTTGMGLSRAMNYAIAGERNEATEPTVNRSTAITRVTRRLVPGRGRHPGALIPRGHRW